jgi:hypothetical protein
MQAKAMRQLLIAILQFLLLTSAAIGQAGQAKPLTKVIAGYGSTDGAIAPL